MVKLYTEYNEKKYSIAYSVAYRLGAVFLLFGTKLFRTVGVKN